VIATARQWIAPAYLLACLLLGGSIQGVGFVLILQLTGVALLGWALLGGSQWRWRPQARVLPWIAGLLVLVALLQLVPLPPAVWSALPGRTEIAEGYRLLGQPIPWRPVSLAPDESIALLLTFIPPAAMAVLIIKSRAYSGAGLTLAIVLAALVAAGLGVAQVTSNGRYYLYPFVAMGTPAGQFANPNHAAALLLVTIPFAASFAAIRRSSAKKPVDRLVPLMLAGLLLALLAVAIALNGSLAVVLLAVPTVVASAFLFVPAGRVRLARIGLLLATLVLVGVAALSVGARYGLGDSGRVSMDSRQQIWSRTTAAVGDHWMSGSGLGTFAQVYRLYEDPAKVDRYYVNHAHNDYLELILELGVVGMLVIALFLAWWARCALAVWRSPDASPFARAATIASAVLMLHSAVDFPLRTAALAALFGTLIALMAAADPVPSGGNRRPRHRTIQDLA
jgi:O-antigen ligase